MSYRRVTTRTVASSQWPSIGLDESYELRVDVSGTATLAAETLSGAVAGFETLAQLVYYDGTNYVLPNLPISIRDHPRFAWRGLLLDSARHFVPVTDVQRTLDGMAALKLNVLHWHLTDSQAFTLQLSRLPALARMGALHPRLTYSRQDVQSIVAYARDRGASVCLPVPVAMCSCGEGALGGTDLRWGMWQALWWCPKLMCPATRLHGARRILTSSSIATPLSKATG